MSVCFGIKGAGCFSLLVVREMMTKSVSFSDDNNQLRLSIKGYWFLVLAFKVDVYSSDDGHSGDG